MPTPVQSSRPKIDPVAQQVSTSGVSLSLVEARKYSLKEAAKVAGISESTMRNEVKNGEIPVIKIGTKAIIVQWDLEQYLQRHRIVEGASATTPIGCQDLPDWVDNSPLLQPRRTALCGHIP